MIRNPVAQPVLEPSSAGDSTSSQDMSDEKYMKRRSQQRTRERIKHSLFLFGSSLMVLMYTWNTLTNTDLREKSSRSQGGGARVHPSPPRGSRQLKDRSKSGEEDDRTAEGNGGNNKLSLLDKVLGRNPSLVKFRAQLEDMDQDIIHNVDRGVRWTNTEFLPPLSPSVIRPLMHFDARKKRNRLQFYKEFMAVKRLARRTVMDWETKVGDIPLDKGPLVDFTKHDYEYPQKLYDLPKLGDYPKLKPMKEIMKQWPQDEIDHPPSPFVEDLMHFDFRKPEDLEAAILFRDAKLPFKLMHVPEVVGAGRKWTDDYLIDHFDEGTPSAKRAQGSCQESPDNFFAFFIQGGWSVDEMGIPPTRNNDWTFAKWIEHARYADATGLSPHQPHFYWQGECRIGLLILMFYLFYANLNHVLFSTL